MNERDKALLALVGATEEDTQPHDRVGDVEETADMAYVNSELAIALIEEVTE